MLIAAIPSKTTDMIPKDGDALAAIVHTAGSRWNQSSREPISSNRAHDLLQDYPFYPGITEDTFFRAGWRTIDSTSFPKPHRVEKALHSSGIVYVRERVAMLWPIKHVYTLQF